MVWLQRGGYPLTCPERLERDGRDGRLAEPPRRLGRSLRYLVQLFRELLRQMPDQTGPYQVLTSVVTLVVSAAHPSYHANFQSTRTPMYALPRRTLSDTCCGRLTVFCPLLE